jgi:putative membrane protein
MLVMDNPSWFRVVRSVRGSTLPKTWGRLLLVMIVACGITYLHVKYDWLEHDLTLAPFQLTGVALGIFLGFRNNTSFDRYWEGRKLWGQIVNSTRSASRMICSFVGPTTMTPEIHQRHKDLVYHVIAWTHATRQHLRRQDDLSEYVGLLHPAEIERLKVESNRPNAIMQHLSLMLRQDQERGWLNPMQQVAIEQEMCRLIDSQGGCERIKSTPIPYAYTVLLHQVVAAYCFALPFGLVHGIGIYTPIVVFLVAYAFFGLDAVGDELEDPFGEDPNDLPLFTISRMIEVNLRERLFEEEKPALLRPVKNLLT